MALIKLRKKLPAKIDTSRVHGVQNQQKAATCFMYSLHRNTLRHDAFPRPSHDSDGYRPASHCGRPGSIDGSSTWNLWWTKWQWDRFYLRVFQFSPVSNIPAILHVHLSNLSNWQRRYINTLRFRAVSYKDRYLLLNLSIYFIYLLIIYLCTY